MRELRGLVKEDVLNNQAFHRLKCGFDMLCIGV